MPREREPMIVVRAPTLVDAGRALGDLVSLRAAPPMIVSAALVMILTGSLLVTLSLVCLTSYVHAFWARLCEPR
jgi:hypothetical protein